MNQLPYLGSHEPQTVQDQIDEAIASAGGGLFVANFTIRGTIESKSYDPHWVAPANLSIIAATGARGWHDPSTHPYDGSSTVTSTTVQFKIYDFDGSGSGTFTNQQIDLVFAANSHQTAQIANPEIPIETGQGIRITVLYAGGKDFVGTLYMKVGE